MLVRLAIFRPFVARARFALFVLLGLSRSSFYIVHLLVLFTLVTGRLLHIAGTLVFEIFDVLR